MTLRPIGSADRRIADGIRCVPCQGIQVLKQRLVLLTQSVIAKDAARGCVILETMIVEVTVWSRIGVPLRS